MFEHRSRSSTYSGLYLPLQIIVLLSSSLYALISGTCFQIPTSSLSFSSKPLYRLFPLPGPLFYSTCSSRYPTHLSILNLNVTLLNGHSYCCQWALHSHRILHVTFQNSHYICNFLFNIYLPH